VHYTGPQQNLKSHCFSTNLGGLQNLVKMATEFTWSELPTRNPVTGSRTLAGWIARSQTLAWSVANFVLGSHALYLVLRIVTKNANPVFFNAWFPFDLDNGLLYTLVLVLQVMAVVADIMEQFVSSLYDLLSKIPWGEKS